MRLMAMGHLMCLGTLYFDDAPVKDNFQGADRSGNHVGTCHLAGERLQTREKSCPLHFLLLKAMAS